MKPNQTTTVTNRKPFRPSRCECGEPAAVKRSDGWACVRCAAIENRMQWDYRNPDRKPQSHHIPEHRVFLPGFSMA